MLERNLILKILKLNFQNFFFQFVSKPFSFPNIFQARSTGDGISLFFFLFRLFIDMKNYTSYNFYSNFSILMPWIFAN